MRFDFNRRAQHIRRHQYHERAEGCSSPVGFPDKLEISRPRPAVGARRAGETPAILPRPARQGASLRDALSGDGSSFGPDGPGRRIVWS
jgi:hypothetical protein